MADSITQQQGLLGRPQIEGMSEGTNLIVPPVRSADRLAHFPSDLYDLSPESHLTRFLKAMLGDAGAGRLSKTGLLARLEHSLQGTHFFDLDSFYGALFGTQRRRDEVIEGDPFTEVFTDAEWDEIAARDDSYRARIEQFARAINYGATPTGVLLMAEALLNVECDVYESFLTQDRSISTYADLEAAGTYADLEALGTYADLESDGGDPTASMNRAVFTVVPKRQITDEERYDLIRVLNVLKPAGSILRISPLGRPHLTPVKIRGAAADSEMWKVRRSTIESGQAVPKKRPPFTSYQGEAWTHLGSLLGVTSYNLNDDGSTENWGLVGVVKVGGTTYTYTPDLGLVPLSLVLSGRAASDGVVVRHPYRSAPRNRVPFYWREGYYENAEQFEPGRKNGVYITGFWADGYAIVDQGQKILFNGGQKTRQTFWATPERRQTDDRGEVLEIKLRSTQLVNHVSFEVSRFPMVARAEAWDEEVSAWRTLRTWTVSDSFPQRFSRFPASADYHPQHSAPGHWLKCSDTVVAVRTQRIRLVLKRSTRGRGPITASGNAAAYSLAVKNFDIGYRLRSRNDIPQPDESLGGIIATTFDSAGKPMAMDIVENPASNALLDGTAIWRSEPQPTNRAVVSYYLDVREPGGGAQVIDTLYLNPSRSGPSMNLYWSDDEGAGIFPASDKPIDYSTVGVVGNTPGGITFDAEDANWLEIDNDEIHFDPSLDDWWFGCQFKVNAPTSASDSLKVLMTDGVRLSIAAGYDPTDDTTKIGLIAFGEDSSIIGLATVPLEAPANTPITVSARYNKVLSRFYLDVSVNGTLHSGEGPVTGPLVRPETLTIGGLSIFPGGDLTMTGFFLKTGIEADEIETMAEDFDSYVLRKSPGTATNDYTTNSIVRYHPSFSSQDRIGLRGGPADLWAARIWHPIERDYRLTKGFISLPPTRAKFWKLEFTNLAPEPMESMLPITRHVRVFPSEILRAYGERELRPAANQWPGLKPAMRVARDAQYRDTPADSPRKPAALPPTSAQYVPEIQRARQMREDFSWLYGMQPWQAGHDAPRFHSVGSHVYNEFDLVDATKVGFFVGLTEVRALRTDYEVDDDTPVYRERFLDDANWVDGYTWNLDPGEFYTTDSNATATSKVFRSRHPVRAIQYAAHQSDAVQIIPDDTFSSVELAESDWTDSTKWHASGDGIITYRAAERMVTVNRDVAIVGGSQNYITFPPDPTLGDVYRSPDGMLAWTWDGADWVRSGSSILGRPLAPVFSFRPSSAAPVSQTYGGIESPLSATSDEGMIHAAARVTAVTDIVNPLVLQIIGSDDSVLAEEQVYLRAGETKEWYVSYQLGSFARTPYQLFEPQSLLNGGAPSGQQYGILRPVMDHTTPTPTGETPTEAPDALVRVRLVQEGASKDAWEVDRLSCFDDSILWEFSVDGGAIWHKALNIRCNPYGVLSFPRPSNGLCWRLTSYRPRRVVTSLQVRPWYEHQMGTVMGVPQRGANISAFDHHPPITQDPEFKVWSRPVPRWWWLEGRRSFSITAPGEPLTNPTSDFYARTSTDEVDVPSDEALSEMYAARANSDGLDGDGFPLIGTELPTPTSEATAGSGIFTRSASSSVPVPSDEQYVSMPSDDGILRPPLEPPPTAGD